MLDDLESKIGALEAEIRAKNEIITRLNRAALLGQLLSTYIHEERNMLSALSSALSRFFRLIELSEEVQGKDMQGYKEEITKSRAAITRNFERLRNLLDHFVQFNTASSLRSEATVSLNNCIRETADVVSRLFQRSDVLLQVRLSPEGETLNIPDLAIRQVLVNILFNALESLQDADKKDGVVIIETFFDKSFAKIRVSDNGYGIRTEFIEKIWQPGFSTKPHKVGLGLTVAKEIVESLGGHISANSETGELTQFTVMIPLQQEMTK